MIPLTVSAAVRPFAQADYGRFVEITDAIYTGYRWSVGEAVHEDEAWDRKYFRERIVADVHGTVVAVAQIAHMPLQFHPARYAVDVLVDPPFRRQGVGSLLFAQLLEVARRRGGQALRATVLESQSEALRFLTRRGFREAQRAWESRLRISAFPFAGFARVEDALAEYGITIQTFAQLRTADDDADRKLYALYEQTVRDAPHLDPITPPTFEHFVAEEICAPTALLDGWFVALHAREYVGLSTLMDSPNEAGVVYQNFVGVRADHRGRGIATGMKTRTSQYLRAIGREEIRTWNNTRNVASQAMNKAMGFVREAAYSTLEGSVS